MSSTAEADEKFLIRRQGRRLGPFDRSQINRMIARQKLGPKDEIALAGNNQWQRIDQWQLGERASVDPESKIDEVLGEQVADLPDAASNNPRADDLDAGDWYVSNNGDQQGPIDEHTLGSWISERRINAETLLWRNGMQGWKPAREVLPAALVSSLSPATHGQVSNLASSSMRTDSNDGGYSLRDLRSRRAFWVLTVCIITYVFAVESFAAGFLQIYAAVATRRFDNGGLVALWAVSSLVFAGLLLMTAVEMTKLLSKMSYLGNSENSVAVARHEHRVWLFAGLSAAFIIANQIVLAIFFLITIAQAT